MKEYIIRYALNFHQYEESIRANSSTEAKELFKKRHSGEKVSILWGLDVARNTKV